MTSRPISAREATVTSAFDEVGAHYDRLTGMSPGYADQLLFSARLLVARLPRRPGPEDAPLRIADLGCGSGASTQALLIALVESGCPFRIEGIDGSAGMLAQARAKRWPESVTFRHAQAEELGVEECTPGDTSDLAAGAAGDGAGYDGVFAAYLVRNVPDADAFCRHVHRMLRPGGVFVVHDYGVAGRPLDVAAWTALCWGVIIPSSLVVARKPGLFRYLWRSVLDFDSDERLRRRLLDAGFTDVGQRPVPGWQRGMVRATWGRRP